MSSTTTPTARRHEIVRVRHEIVRRKLVVDSIEDITPRMRRIRLRSPALAGFQSLSPDDHIKLFFAAFGGEPVMRDFTPRAFDAAQNLLTIDFALHGEGPANEWAAGAQVGDTLEIGGPRGSLVVPDDFDWYLFIGDESALPAIGRWVETRRPDVPVTTLVTIASEAEKQALSTRASWTPRWIVRGEPSERDGDTLCAASRALTLPPGDGFVWIAGEDALVRSVRTCFTEERRHPTDWMKASAYWHREKDADRH